MAGPQVYYFQTKMIFTGLMLKNVSFSPRAPRSELMWDSLPWPSRLSERASWTSPHATWIILWVFCCARPSAQWTCLPAWHPSTCRCGRASRAPCSSSASWCTCSTGSTRLGFPWDLCPPPRCTIPCGSSTAPSSSKVRRWRFVASPLQTTTTTRTDESASRFCERHRLC